MTNQKYRLAHREEINAYQRKYRAEHKEQTRDINRRYRLSHPVRFTLAHIRNHEKNSHKLDPKKCRHRCRVWMFWAIRHGIIKRPNKCSICHRKTFVQAHHEDYTKPLQIIWACRPCHTTTFHANNTRRPSNRERGKDWVLAYLKTVYLHKRGFNQCQISRIIGVNNSTICKYLGGAKPRKNKVNPATRQAELDAWIASLTVV